MSRLVCENATLFSMETMVLKVRKMRKHGTEHRQASTRSSERGGPAKRICRSHPTPNIERCKDGRQDETRIGKAALAQSGDHHGGGRRCVGAAFTQLPRGAFSTELSRIGQGTPALVVARDSNYLAGAEVMDLINIIRPKL
jgi:hypothetical protein